MEPGFSEKETKYQEMLCRLPGIFSAKVVLAETGIPCEIHVLAADTRSAKVLTRDIQSALMAAFDLSVDYRIISIAQARPSLMERPFRLYYTGVETRFTRSEGEVSVCLTAGGEEYRGEARCSRHASSRIRGVAKAALAAVRAFDEQKNYELLFAESVVCAGKSIALVGVMEGQGKQLVGSAYLEEDSDDAFVRAVLNAVNRQLSYTAGA